MKTEQQIRDHIKYLEEQLKKPKPRWHLGCAECFWNNAIQILNWVLEELPFQIEEKKKKNSPGEPKNGT
jgi:hypothetical protein